MLPGFALYIWDVFDLLISRILGGNKDNMAIWNCACFAVIWCIWLKKMLEFSEIRSSEVFFCGTYVITFWMEVNGFVRGLNVLFASKLGCNFVLNFEGSLLFLLQVSFSITLKKGGD